MWNFFHDNKGAVTVFVTLLLIPAILISGTGVDLSRLYAARSTVHNANQLAANSILASYDALLQDLYGLYAVVSEDDNLTAMVDTYVKASLFGEEVTDAKMGEFRLFWGQESISSEVESFDPLSNVDILRRQIEEYAKWRVPVAIVGAVLDKLKSDEFKEMASNNEAVMDKLEVDEKLQEAAEKYKAVKDKVDLIKQNYDRVEKAAFDDINWYISKIQTQLKKLFDLRSEYEEETDIEKKVEIEQQFNAIKENLNHLINSGYI